MSSVAESNVDSGAGVSLAGASSGGSAAASLAAEHGGLGNLDMAGLAQDVAARQQADPEGAAQTVAELDGIMSPVERGQFAAALEAVPANDNVTATGTVAGHAFETGHPDAPAIADWGNQPAGLGYREAWNDVAARLGTTDQGAITAAIETELYGAPSAAPQGAPSALAPDPAQLALDLTQMALDITGIVDPTPISDGSNAVLSVGRAIGSAVSGDWSDAGGHMVNAGISAVGVVPALGDLAKAGKIGKWAQTVADSVSAVTHNPALRETLEPALRGIKDAVDKIPQSALDALPASARESIESMKSQLDTFFAGGARAADDVAVAAGRERIVMDGGSKGDWPAELNARNLKPNADYVVNGYTYKTDEAGRVTSVEGSLDLSTADRNSYQQRVSGREDRLPDDQGGHLIASIFNGPGDRLNLVPMDGNFNMGAWKSMETSFADALKAGKEVDVNIDVIYNSTTGRPDAFVVDYAIDGVAETKTFMNRPGG